MTFSAGASGDGTELRPFGGQMLCKGKCFMSELKRLTRFPNVFRRLRLGFLASATACTSVGSGAEATFSLIRMCERALNIQESIPQALGTSERYKTPTLLL